MGFAPKTWQNGPTGGTPIDAVALVDLETRLAAYTDAVAALKASLASPALTGTPTAPTATALDNSTKIATTAYADVAVAVEVARAQAAEALKAQNLAATVVKTSGYTAIAADFIPVDVSAGSVTVTLPSAPATGSRVGVKVVKVDNAHANSVTIARAGSDVFNVSGGSTSMTLSALFQGVILQYASGVWYVHSLDSASGQANGGATLNTSGTLTAGQIPASLVGAATVSAVNAFTGKNTYAATNANYVSINGGALADPGMQTQSTFYAVNGNILNPDAGVRPVAASNFFYVVPGSAPLVNTDFHGWDLNTVAPVGSNVNSSTRIYALESAAHNKSNTTMGDLVAIYGNIALGAGGSSGGSGGFCRSVQASIDLNSGATVTSWAAFYIRAPFKNDSTGGTVTTAYGLYIPNWTGNSATITTAYAIWVNQGGGQLLTQENVIINNVSGQVNTASAALSINTDSTKLADAVDITNAGTGYGINLTQNGTSQPALVITNASGNAHSCATLTQNGAAQGLVVNQNGAQAAATFTLASGASGFYGLVLNGYSHGLSVTTNASSSVNGAGMTVTYNKTAGSGIVAQLINKGTGVYLDINNGTSSLLQIDNSGNFVSTTTGIKIATATTQKLGFFNAAPVAQQSAVGAATGYAAGATVATFHSDDTYTGNTGSTAYTLNGIVAALKNLGLIAA